MGQDRRPKLAVWKFASCDGCQLSLFGSHCLLEIASSLEIAHFPEASSASVKGPYDISLVEGSVTTAGDADRIQKIRRASKVLVTIGACATAGGIQALRNFSSLPELVRLVYPTPGMLSALARSTPIKDHVFVDFELRGCPVSREQVVEVLGAFLHGRRPAIPSHSVCIECKRRGTTCLTVARGVPCMGPVTHAGCGAICPVFGRGCYGCFGPMETANTDSMTRLMSGTGMSSDEIVRAFRGINAGDERFRRAAERAGAAGGGA